MHVLSHCEYAKCCIDLGFYLLFRNEILNSYLWPQYFSDPCIHKLLLAPAIFKCLPIALLNPSIPQVIWSISFQFIKSLFKSFLFHELS